MSKKRWFSSYLQNTNFSMVRTTDLTLFYITCCTFAYCPYFRVQLCGFLHFLPLLQPQNTTHFMFISMQVHVLVLIHDVGHLHGGGRSSGLHGTGSITGVMPTSVALYPSLIWNMILSSASSWLLESSAICVSVPANSFLHSPLSLIHI